MRRELNDEVKVSFYKLKKLCQLHFYQSKFDVFKAISQDFINDYVFKNNSSIGIFHATSRIIRNFLYKIAPTKSLECGTVELFNVPDREDLHELIYSYWKDSGKVFSRDFKQDLEKNGRNKFSPRFNYLKTIWTVFFQFKGINISVSRRVLLLDKIIYYDRVYDYALLRFDCQEMKSLLVFNDVVGYDVILCQAFKVLNPRIISFTFQHGIPLVINSKSFGISSLIYSNFSADFMFVWGAYGKQLFSSIQNNTNRYLILGHPQKSEQKRGNLVKSIDYHCVIVYGSSPNWYKSNCQMISIAKTYAESNKYQFYIQLHPSDNREIYMNELCLTSDCFELPKVDDLCAIRICYHSTIYYTLLTLSCAVFRFRDSDFHQFYGLDDMFEDIDGLKLKIKNYGYVDRIEYTLAVDELLRMVYGDLYKNSTFNNIIYDHDFKGIF